MRCKICGFECLEEGEMSLHAFEEHDLQLEDIVEETTAEEEALSIDDSPETSVVEESGVPAYVVEPENETEKKERLHWALGGKKEMPRPVKTSNAFLEYYRGVFDKVTHPATEACPMCGEHLGKLVKDELGMLITFENLTYQLPEIFVTHCQVKHIPIYKMMKALQLTFTGEAPLPGGQEMPSGPLLPHQRGSPNPEACQAEDLSEEPDSKRFLEQLSEKVKQGQEMTSAERQRFLRLWKAHKETR